jgi:two-component system response regulator (stage 0 sporulation protein F)
MATILLVDDEQNVLEYFAEELTEEGHQIFALDSGEQLIERIASYRPDVVVLDIKFPNCDGLDLLQEIRNQFYDLPVILCSAYDTFREDPRSMAADHYVVKSYNLSELKTKIRMAIEAYEPGCATGISRVHTPNAKT